MKILTEIKYGIKSLLLLVFIALISPVLIIMKLSDRMEEV